MYMYTEVYDISLFVSNNLLYTLIKFDKYMSTHIANLVVIKHFVESIILSRYIQ